MNGRASQGVTGFQPVDSDKTTGWKPVAPSSTGKTPVTPSYLTGEMPVITPLRPFNRGAETQRSRRNLPHWQQAGCTYFVTFRLADSLPQSQLKAWQEDRAVWLKVHPEPWTAEVADEYEKRFPGRIQTWLDAGYGSCALSQSPVQELVAGALRFFDRQRYQLGHFVLMPNHVHVLVTPTANFALSAILHSWKSYTANKVNELVGRTGTFWMDENFDHIVRSTDQLRHFERYIGENPVKAGLRTGTFLFCQGVTGFQPVGPEPETGKMPVTPCERVTGFQSVDRQGDTGILPVESKETTGRMPVAHCEGVESGEITGKMSVAPLFWGSP